MNSEAEEFKRRFDALVEEPNIISVEERMLQASEDAEFVEFVAEYLYEQRAYEMARNPDQRMAVNHSWAQLLGAKRNIMTTFFLTEEQCEIAFTLTFKALNTPASN